MPNYQAGVNQLLGMGAIFSQLPSGQKIGESSRLKRQISNVGKQVETYTQKASPETKKTSEYTQGLSEYASAAQSLAQKQFELKPSEKNLQTLQKAKSVAKAKEKDLALANIDEAIKNETQKLNALKGSKGTPESLAASAEIASEGERLQKQGFNLSPTPSRAREYLRSKANAATLASMKEQAMKSMQEKGQAQVNQGNELKSLKESILKEPTSLGGTVGDLPENMQEVIIKERLKEHGLNG